MSEKKPLTALEWLRVTHAETLSGRRIEEAVATARRKGEAAGYGNGLDEGIALGRGEAERLRQAVRQIADNLAAASKPPILNDFDRGVTATYADVAQQLRATLDES